MESEQGKAVATVSLRPIGRIRSPFREAPGTPLLDPKPHAPALDALPSFAAGWLDESGAVRTRADGRFHE